MRVDIQSGRASWGKATAPACVAHILRTGRPCRVLPSVAQHPCACTGQACGRPHLGGLGALQVVGPALHQRLSLRRGLVLGQEEGGAPAPPPGPVPRAEQCPQQEARLAHAAQRGGRNLRTADGPQRLRALLPGAAAHQLHMPLPA